jgi:DNA-binding response OmpR family regulator/predicted Ser/Thr protein kinase
MNSKNNILFINRNESFLKNQGESLRKAGYSVLTAMDIRSALSTLSSNSIELIICDNTLKDVNGYEFLHFLKNDPLRENIPFVFFVPIDDQGKASQAFKLGAADFIVYPLKTEAFVLRIKEALSAHGNPQARKAEQAVPNIEEKRQSKRTYSLPALHVEVSRDNVLWMPCKIKNINRNGMFLKTSLLAKPGVELYVKVFLPTETPIVKGKTKHIDFKNRGPSTGIGLEIEASDKWKKVLQYLASLVKEQNLSPPEKKADNPLILSGSIKPEQKISQASTQPPELSQESKESYVVRFYRSLIGKQLDNYKIVSFIGAGGMGGVFKGWDIALERAVALKIISYELSGRKAFQKLFIKEARFVSKLDHQNIARIYHIGNANQILYFSMEFIDGVTLAELIKKGENLNTLKGLDYLITIAEALDFVSQKNIIHRDIKPPNIMINDKGTVKIVDFGVAKIVDVNSKNQKKEGIVGSPLYISPESITGSSLDHRSDIYSLGASFYHAFTKLPPFDGKSADEVLLKHVEKELTPLKKRNPKVSNALGKIIEKMMAKKPEDRYQHYKDIVKDLKAIRSRVLNFQKLKNATLIFRIKRKKAP